MFYNLIEYIKETHPEVLKRVLIDFINGYTDIEDKIDLIEKQIKENELNERNVTIRKAFDDILFSNMAKIDGKIEFLDEFEEMLSEAPIIKTLNGTQCVIDRMLTEYKNCLSLAKSETLKMYYEIKIDTLNELKDLI